MDASTVQNPSRRRRYQPVEELHQEYAKTRLAHEMALRAERLGDDPNYVPGMAYARSMGRMSTLCREAIASAEHYREMWQLVRDRCNELEDRIAELEGDDPHAEMDARSDALVTKDLG